MKKRLIYKQSVITILLCASFFLLQGCGGTVGGGESPGGSVGSGQGKANLSWEAPTTNADGSTLTDLASYRIYYGTTSPLSKTNSQGLDVGNTTTYTLSGLDIGIFYFAASAMDFRGNESNLSNEVSKEISGA